MLTGTSTHAIMKIGTQCVHVGACFRRFIVGMFMFFVVVVVVLTVFVFLQLKEINEGQRKA